MPLDLSSPQVRAQLAKRIANDIDDFCIKEFHDGNRKHLGASLIGDKCRRKLWYVFRHVQNRYAKPHMYRIWNRGHREEAQYVRYLEGIGFKVWVEEAPGVQFRMAECGGHFGGSIDGASIPPDRYDIGQPLLLEFKTHNTGPHWVKLIENGVAHGEPKHFRQMSMYGKYKGLKYALYLNTNKNDDSIHVEIVELDWMLAGQDINKADEIIRSQEAPPRLSENPTHFECKQLCDFWGICHNGDKMEVTNCRSCKHAFPIDRGQWWCNLNRATIPDDVLPIGCSHRLPLDV